MSKISEIITALELERARIDQAIALLKEPATSTTMPAKKKRNLSPEGRARIAEAVRKRWAAQKRAAKKGA